MEEKKEERVKILKRLHNDIQINSAVPYICKLYLYLEANTCTHTHCQFVCNKHNGAVLQKLIITHVLKKLV